MILAVEPAAGNGYGGDVFREMVVPPAFTVDEGRRAAAAAAGEVAEAAAEAAGGDTKLLAVLGGESSWLAAELRVSLDVASPARDTSSGAAFCAVAAGDRGWGKHLAAALWSAGGAYTIHFIQLYLKPGVVVCQL